MQCNCDQDSTFHSLTLTQIDQSLKDLLLFTLFLQITIFFFFFPFFLFLRLLYLVTEFFFVGMKKKMRENVKDDGEFEMLLGEIPHHFHQRHGNVLVGGDHVDSDHVSFVKKKHGSMLYYEEDPSITHMKFPCASSPVTVSGFSLHSDGSSSSLFSGPHSDNGSPPPLLEDLKSSSYTPAMSSGIGSSYWLDSKIPDLRDNANVDSETHRFVDQLGLCNANFSKIYIGNHQQGSSNPNPISTNVYNPINVHNNNFEDYNSYKRGFLDSSDSLGFQFQSPFPRNHQDYEMANLYGSQSYPRKHESILPQLNRFTGGSMPMDSPRQRMQIMNNYYCRGNVAPDIGTPLRRNPAIDASLYAQKYGMNSLQSRGMPTLPDYTLHTNFRPYMTAEDLLQYPLPLPNARAVPPSNARTPQGSVDAITREGSFILQGESSNYVVGRGWDGSRCGSVSLEPCFARHLQRPQLDIRNQVARNYENPRSPRIGFPLTSPPRFNSLAEAQGNIYMMAKDQNGCRLLQRMFDEGTSEDVQVIFNEIIGHVVELMMNPFGNYLMQKLLDVCNEDQRIHILHVVTAKPGQLGKISLSSHGTRVVQKLIETLRTREQILLVISALEPEFLDLIKDLNGNHVVQHCLQCLSNEDNKFIFAAAAEHCVEIATHQHGCCVLQKCIGNSSGQHRENLVSKISANALQLAENQYGNYVVQLILDLRIPSATATVTSKFEGQYVHLSMQKFSSHVVEKCLAVLNNETQTRIIEELLLAPHFEQLLQDPHANYVIQTALRHSVGHVHNSLVQAIESHKAVSRNSPYSKKLLSQKFLKK